MSDLYATLGVKKTATAAQLKRAFRKRSKETHPDRNVGDPAAPERFKAVMHAWRILSDSERRKRYDATGDASDTPDNTHTAIAEVLTHKFREVVAAVLNQGGKLTNASLLDGIKTALKARNAELAKAKQSMEKARAELQALAGRFTTTDGAGENVFDGILQFDLDAMDRQLKTVEAEKALNEKAIEYLKAYQFRQDLVTATARNGVVRTGVPTTTSGWITF